MLHQSLISSHLYLQMVHHDQTQEVIAAIRMAINRHDAAHQLTTATAEGNVEDVAPCGDEMADSEVNSESQHWILGAPQRLANLQQLQESYNWVFEAKLKEFLAVISPANLDSDEFVKVLV